MRKLYFLLPGTKGRFGGGGLWAELNTCALAGQICEAEVVTYRQRETEHPFLDDLLPQCNPNSAIFVVGWGFDVPKLIRQLKGQNIIYHAHSSNYGFSLPAGIPIVTVSRNTMGYWGQKAPNSLIYYLPNQIGDEFYDQERSRDIDILVQTRKSSEYLLDSLVPALRSRYRVEVVKSYVKDLAELFNRSKIYLYDSAEYWATSGVTEGFGLPPLEALACGCHVFSSVNHGLSDFLDPGFNCHKIAGYSLEYDLDRIGRVLNESSAKNHQLSLSLLAEYRRENLLARLEVILPEINSFFDHKQQFLGNVPNLNRQRLIQLKIKQIIAKIKRKIGKV
ncbi:MAG: glycosyltransferase [Cyanobacteria bacterium P01_G01_bin.19]